MGVFPGGNDGISTSSSERPGEHDKAALGDGSCTEPVCGKHGRLHSTGLCGHHPGCDAVKKGGDTC